MEQVPSIQRVRLFDWNGKNPSCTLEGALAADDECPYVEQPGGTRIYLPQKPGGVFIESRVLTIHDIQAEQKATQDAKNAATASQPPADDEKEQEKIAPPPGSPDESEELKLRRARKQRMLAIARGQNPDEVAPLPAIPVGPPGAATGAVTGDAVKKPLAAEKPKKNGKTPRPVRK